MSTPDRSCEGEVSMTIRRMLEEMTHGGRPSISLCEGHLVDLSTRRIRGALRLFS
jgi:hypothetical protein